MRLTPKRVMAVVGALATVGTFARVSVLFLESLAAVRDERRQDVHLLELCRQGTARESMKMRSACLQAQAERASPVVLKAVLRAFSAAFEDFADAVSTPAKLLVAVLFALTSIFLPINTWLRAILPPEEPQDGDGRHVVVFTNDDVDDACMSARQRLRRAVGALRLRRLRCAAGRPHIQLPSEDGLLEVGGGDDATTGMLDVDLGGHRKWE